MIILKFFLLFAVVFLGYVAIDKWLIRQQIQWVPNILFSLFVSLFNGLLVFEGGSVFAIPLTVFLSILFGYALGVFQSQNTDVKFSCKCENKTPPESQNCEKHGSSHCRVWDGL